MAIFDKTEAQAGGGIDRREPLLNQERTFSQVRAAELKFAMGVAGAAAALRGPYPAPSDNELTIEDDDTGDETVYRFADSAVARAGVAVLEQFKEEPAKGLALLMRWSALSRLINDARMQPYMRRACDGSGGVDVRPEAIEVAAELPLDEHGQFAANEFFRKLNGRVARSR
jgi:hypothetical protein